MITQADRLEILVNTPRKLPVGQMCRKLEYPEVTTTQLEERFAVHKQAEAFNAKEEARVWDEFAKESGLTLEASKAKYTLDLQAGTYTLKPEPASVPAVTAGQLAATANSWSTMRATTHQATTYRWVVTSDLAPGIQWTDPATTRLKIKAKYCWGKVEIEPLDEYMKDEIPERVLESLDVAREAGLTDFHVAYPVIEVRENNLSESVYPKDPVLLARLGDRYLEIDLWE